MSVLLSIRKNGDFCIPLAVRSLLHCEVLILYVIHGGPLAAPLQEAVDQPPQPTPF